MCYSAMVHSELDYLGASFNARIDEPEWQVYAALAKQDPKLFPALADRIYPGHYAPIILQDESLKNRVALARYGVFPKASIKNPKAYSTFNARRDNLMSPFWDHAFRKQHGVVVLKSFFEWVSVRDLLSAGVVKLQDVEAEFAKQARARQAKILAQGKKYQKTATERLAAEERQIIIEFRAEANQPLFVPVIYAPTTKVAGLPGDKTFTNGGFAIITDEPTDDIRAAGHDRCPIILEPEALAGWLDCGQRSTDDLLEILGKPRQLRFRHRLAA